MSENKELQERVDKLEKLVEELRVKLAVMSDKPISPHQPINPSPLLPNPYHPVHPLPNGIQPWYNPQPFWYGITVSINDVTTGAGESHVQNN